MFEFVRQKAAVLVALLLVYVAWSALGDEAAGKTSNAKSKLEGIRAENLSVCDPSSRVAVTRDPTGLMDLSSYVSTRHPAPVTAVETPKPAPVERAAQQPAPVADLPVDLGPPVPADEEDASDWTEQVRRVMFLGLAGLASLKPPAELGAAGAENKEPPVVAAEPAPVEPPKPTARFTLTLESTLGAAGGGQALISGQTVQVGQVLGGMDPEAPPMLLRVDGSRAVLAYRGKELTLDLDGKPRIDIGGPPPVAVLPTASPSAPRAAAPASAGAPAPRPAASHGAYRVRGKNKGGGR